MYKELENRILTGRGGRFTLAETAELFQEDLTSEFLLQRALQDKFLDPNYALLQIIPRCIDKDYVIPLALCLRFGADPNMYVNDPKIGNIHILGYVYITLYKTKFLNTVAMIFIAKGANPLLSFFDTSAQMVERPESPESQRNNPRTRTTMTNRTVVRWLDDNNYRNIFNTATNVTELKNNTDAKSLIELSLILNDRSLAYDRTLFYEAKDFTLGIRAFCSIDIMTTIPLDLSTGGLETMWTKGEIRNATPLDYKILYDCVKYNNYEIFNYLLLNGFLPSYLLINDILIAMRNFTNVGVLLIVQELEKFILAAVSVGIIFDQEQYNIINTLGFSSSFNKAYNIPYWKKICHQNESAGTGGIGAGPEGKQLRKLALSLNIDPSLNKKAICENLSRLSKIDATVLKDAHRKRQQMRIQSELGYTTEFMDKNFAAAIPGQPTSLSPKNKDNLSYDYLDYNNMDIFFYRDDNGDVWALTSDMFDSVLETGLNPFYTSGSGTEGGALSEMNLIKIKQKKDLLRLLHIEPDPLGIYSANISLSFTEAVDSLTKKDRVSEKQALDLVNRFIILAGYNGVSAQAVRNYTKADMIRKLKNIGYNVDLNSLSTSHALITTAYIVLQNNATAKKFF